MTATRRRCVFCRAEGASEEHVFAKWISDVVPGEGTFLHQSDEPGRRAKPNKIIAITNRATCGPCNTGWMSDLEDQASRILKRMFDEKVSLSLSGDSLRLLSRWCMKTALMIQFIRDVRAIPEAVYDQFFEARTPPTNSLGFIARHAGLISNGANSILYGINAGRPDQGQLYGVTFFIKNVVVQVIGANFDRGLNIRLPHAFTGQVQPLWPETGSVTWPPGTRLDDQSVLAFARSLLELQG